MTAQSGLQRAEQIQALLAQRRQVASDATKGCRSRLAAEGARDLLLDFDQANIALRLVIVKRHDEAVQEGQHGLLVADQAIKQVACSTLFRTSFFAGRRLSVGGSRISMCHQSQELCLPVLNLQRIQSGETCSRACSQASFISSNNALRSAAHSRLCSSANNVSSRTRCTRQRACEQAYRKYERQPSWTLVP